MFLPYDIFIVCQRFNLENAININILYHFKIECRKLTTVHAYTAGFFNQGFKPRVNQKNVMLLHSSVKLIRDVKSKIKCINEST